VTVAIGRSDSQPVAVPQALLDAMGPYLVDAGSPSRSQPPA